MEKESHLSTLELRCMNYFADITRTGIAMRKKIYELQSLKKWSYPNNMLQELQDLIIGLTYNDITNQKNELDNPNPRWTYQEVKKWLACEEQTISGITVTNNSFGGADFDVSFWKLLYKLELSMREFFWKGKSYHSLQDFWKNILIKLRMSDIGEKNFDSSYYEKTLDLMSDDSRLSQTLLDKISRTKQQFDGITDSSSRKNFSAVIISPLLKECDKYLKLYGEYSALRIEYEVVCDMDYNIIGQREVTKRNGK